jgi:hypothetical protein
MTFAPTGSCIGARLVRNGTGNGGALSGDERQCGLDDHLLQKEKGQNLRRTSERDQGTCRHRESQAVHPGPAQAVMEVVIVPSGR